jgi:hypothetical protein
MNPLRVILNLLRRVLRIERKRGMTPRRPKPKIGARAVCEDVRMTIQAGLTDELWEWLLDQGWREWCFRPDRRRYRDIPASWVTRLIDCDPAMRAKVLKGGMAVAINKPMVGDPAALPIYIEIE